MGYDAKWESTDNFRCPNLVHPDNVTKTFEIWAKPHETGFQGTDYYASLASMWSDWNLQYLRADFPRLMLRFEDTLYRLKEVMQIIRDCVGETSDKPFQFLVSRSKRHGRPTDYVAGLLRYTNHEGRHRGLTEADRSYANTVLDSSLMDIFGYRTAPLQAAAEDLQGPYFGWQNPPIDLGLLGGIHGMRAELNERFAKAEREARFGELSLSERSRLALEALKEPASPRRGRSGLVDDRRESRERFTGLHYN